MANSQEVEVQHVASSGASDKVPVAGNEKTVGAAVYNSSHGSLDDINRQAPTPDEVATLRRVPGKIPWISFSIAFVELCERFSYYGTIIVFVNFIQREMPEGSTTGAGGTDRTPGALGLGQRASTGLTLCNGPCKTISYPHVFG
ncbi:hypothetical protein I7I51_07588 [Histoplasma capsulatum]|uniref:Uncharacterized protein n=1 Tax=Ajellomyces capsulatus TaxID=5037 RepID=A0A8A1LY62_AJECA|nr:predicted protein [Histoplasma mississippiense (nom. inval.)]EDN02589.1 predicted protein [Histoplasma mississippiense (nom. inval.)]QSS58165.1 hypothetical protein I7I51_07588 [Histoplasma capsulatum]